MSIYHIGQFLLDVDAEVKRAQKKFPSSDGTLCALTEEVGEVAKAVLDEPWERVYREAVQVAAMAARLALEGDKTLGPIREMRDADQFKANDFNQRCMPGSCPYRGCPAPYKQVPPCPLCYE